MRNSEHTTLHLAHTHPVPWSEIVAVLSRELSLPVAPVSEWLSRFEAAAEGEKAETVPAVKLLEFFRGVLEAETSGKGSEHGEIMGMPKLAMKRALEGSKTLRNGARLGEEDVCLWLKYWSQVGFL